MTSCCTCTTNQYCISFFKLFKSPLFTDCSFQFFSHPIFFLSFSHACWRCVIDDKRIPIECKSECINIICHENSLKLIELMTHQYYDGKWKVQRANLYFFSFLFSLTLQSERLVNELNEHRYHSTDVNVEMIEIESVYG